MWEFSSKHEEHNCSSMLQKLEEGKSRSKRTAEATLPNSQGLRNFATPTKFHRGCKVKMSTAFDFLSFFYFFLVYPHVIVFELYILVICNGFGGM